MSETGKEGREVSERMSGSGGCGGREEEISGQRANEVRVDGKGTWH
jgi:hypothetical protein